MTKSTTVISLTLFFIFSAFPSQSLAKVTGECVNCHTMHNSQNGADMVAGGPYGTLLAGGCVGCHSSGTSSTTYSLGTSTVPVVNYTGGEPGSYLAGGNFYWVADAGGNDDAKGHNVLGIASQDGAITASEGAPGNPYNCSNSCHKTLAVAQTAQADLGSGCEGCHLNVKHHADDSATVVVCSAGGYYRFLSGHMSGSSNGVEGIEDDDWQATKGTGDHNEYLGNEANLSGGAAFYNLGNTMTAFCCGCHGNFHEEQNASGAWIRHPSDAVIPNSAGSEYANAFGAGGTGTGTYDPLVPVARTSLTDWTGPSGTVSIGTDLVMCLSCHRPHGSPYSDLLRWDYSGMIAGTAGAGAGTGCFVCHTNKDGT